MAPVENRYLIFHTPPVFDAPVRGIPSKHYHKIWRGKTGNMWLPEGVDIFKPLDTILGRTDII